MWLNPDSRSDPSHGADLMVPDWDSFLRHVVAADAKPATADRGSSAVRHEAFVRQAIALARDARARGDHPFGALLVLDGQVVLTALNSTFTDGDPTAHAEINLVRQAVRTLSADHIKRAVLFTSCEPCAMCAGAMYWAGIRSVVYALACEELGKMAGPDFLMLCRSVFAQAADRVEVHGRCSRRKPGPCTRATGLGAKHV